MNISDKFPEMSEDYGSLPNISRQTLKMFRSNRNKFRFVQQHKFRFVQQLNLINLIAHMTSVISLHVKIPNYFLSSHVKISCFCSERNPCNPLKFI